MRTILQNIAKTIADEVLYDNKAGQNVDAEFDLADKWVCLIDEISSGRGTTSSNSHSITFPVSFAFCRIVDLERSAVENDAIMQESRVKVNAMLNGIIASGQFAKLPAWGIEKVQENEYDQNYIGWRINIDLTPLEFSGIC